MKKIIIIGNAGSGKSTLARQLNEKLHIPVFHLDQHFWKPGWVYPNAQDYERIHDNLCNQKEWIIEGMQLKLLEHRIQNADTIIYLDISTTKCIYRIFKRTFYYWGKTTPSSAPGCFESFFTFRFFAFIKWVLNFRRKYHLAVNLLLEKYASSKNVIIIKSSTDITALLNHK